MKKSHHLKLKPVSRSTSSGSSSGSGKSASPSRRQRSHHHHRSTSHHSHSHHHHRSVSHHGSHRSPSHHGSHRSPSHHDSRHHHRSHSHHGHSHHHHQSPSHHGHSHHHHHKPSSQSQRSSSRHSHRSHRSYRSYRSQHSRSPSQSPYRSRSRSRSSSRSSSHSGVRSTSLSSSLPSQNRGRSSTRRNLGHLATPQDAVRSRIPRRIPTRAKPTATTTITRARDNEQLDNLRDALSQIQQQIDNLRTEREGRDSSSMSPILQDDNRNKKKLPSMSRSYKKTLHDEVVQILGNLEQSLLFDLSKTFSSQKKHVNKKLLPAVKSAMNPSMKEVYDSEIIEIIKQLHKSRREIWSKRQRGLIEKHQKRQHVASRRDQKISRRKRGLQHMIHTNDPILESCHPETISWDLYMLDCERAINTSELHSDEWSTDDENLANDERAKNKRPDNLKDTNSVIKVRAKAWRSTRIKKIINRAEELGERIGTGLTRIRYRLNDIVDKKSKPSDNIPTWWISSRWIPPESSDEGDNEIVIEDIPVHDKDHNEKDDEPPAPAPPAATNVTSDDIPPLIDVS